MKYFFLPMMLLSLLHSSGLAQLEAVETELLRTQKINYLLYTPTGNQAPYPLVVFLHGGGEGGDDIELVKKHGLPKLIAQGRDFPFYVFAPQNPHINGLWDDRMVNELVDELVRTLPIDTTRIYLAGLSRGGYGVWQLAINNPHKYAAMISICAANIPVNYIKNVSSLPVWFFHGEKDVVIPVQQTIEAYEIMKALKPETRLTIYPEANHDSWTQTFENDEVYHWLLLQRLE
jgi:predicted peptidase